MTGAWLLANDLKQMSDCTGGRTAMQFDTASQNKLLELDSLGRFPNASYTTKIRPSSLS